RSIMSETLRPDPSFQPLPEETAAAAAALAAGSAQKKNAPLLGAVAAHGFAWALMHTFASKLVTVASQACLGWLLLKEDFGLIGLAYTATQIPFQLHEMGMSTVLVQRGKHFRRWASPAFWMSVSFGAFGALIMLAVAPLAARIYHAPLRQLTGLIALIALSTPLY